MELICFLKCGAGSAWLRQPVQKLDVRANGAVHTLDLGIFRFDNVVLVGSVRAASMAEAKRARRQVERLTGEYVTGPRTRAARENDRINPAFAIHFGLNTNERGVGGRAVGIVSPAPADFD